MGVFQRQVQAQALLALSVLVLVSVAFAARDSAAVNDKVVRVELMQRDHPSSPLRSASLNSTGEIFLAAVKRGHARRTRLANHLLAGGSLFTTPVASGNGEYVLDISFGTPPQKSSAIVDTGSDLNWVQCLPCEVCYESNSNKFNPAKSATYKTLGCTSDLCNALPYQSCGASCQYDYLYGDGSSTSGDLSSDTVTLGNGKVGNVAFGCGHTNLGSFAGAGGLVGLGQGPLSLISQLGTVTAKVFSYCLVPLGSASTSPLYIGDSKVAAGVVYTPMLQNRVNPTFYYAGVNGISVNGKAVVYPAGTFDLDASGQGGLILDSGTTLTYLEAAAFNPVVEALKAAIPYPVSDGSFLGLEYCFSTAGVANPTYPSMVFHFDDAADFELTPNNIFVALDLDGTTCLAMAASSGFSILGNIQQQGHLVVHDLENQRIGFRSAECETL